MIASPTPPSENSAASVASSLLASTGTRTGTRTGALAIAVAIFVGVGCGAAPQRFENRVNRLSLSPVQLEEHKQNIAAGDSKWENRSDRTELQAALSHWESAIKIKDDDHATYAKLARGYYFLADAFLAFDAMDGSYPYSRSSVVDQRANAALLNAHLRGSEHAERGLASASSDFEKRMLSGIPIEEAIAVLDRSTAALVYWYASNLGKWAVASGMATALKHKDRIYKAVFHVYETAPDFHFRGADRFLGAFFAAAPTFAGGDLGKAEKHFQAALAGAPEFLATAVLAAEILAIKTDNAEAFDSYLAIVKNSPDGEAEISPENQLEKRKAEALSARRAQFFE